MNDFTLEKYSELLSHLSSEDIQVYGVAQWMKGYPSHGIVLRHDVDSKPENALLFARAEEQQRIQSTFYFRITKNSFNESIIKDIVALGHEVGYHYEDLVLAQGNKEKAWDLFKQHLEQLRRIVPIETIAMHGSPLSRFNNLDLWKKFDFRKLGILAEVYLSFSYREMFYFTDTGRTWGESRANLRDRVESRYCENVKSTDDLIHFIADNTKEKMMIVSHPERWDSQFGPWVQQLVKDRLANGIKLVAHFIRRR